MIRAGQPDNGTGGHRWSGSDSSRRGHSAITLFSRDACVPQILQCNHPVRASVLRFFESDNTPGCQAGSLLTGHE
jgi:hypothetical protein